MLVYRLLWDWLIVGIHSHSTGQAPNQDIMPQTADLGLRYLLSQAIPSAGIFHVNDVFYFCCFSFCCAGWLLEDWLSEDAEDIWGAGLVLLGRSRERGPGTVAEGVISCCFSWMNTSIMIEGNVKGLYTEESFQFLKPYCTRNKLCVAAPVSQ